jgi:hypothetical protein
MSVQSPRADFRYSTAVVTNSTFDTQHLHGHPLWTSGVPIVGRVAAIFAQE